MVKRLLAAVMALAMVLTLIPAVVSAEDPVVKSDKAGTHTAAEHKCEECGTTQWLPWDSATTLPKSGHYYLTKDVTMTAPINDFAGTAHICLNGFVVKAASGKHHFNTRGVAEVVITDCTAYYDAEEVYHAGAFTGGQDGVNGGGVAFIRRGGVVKVYDGRFTGNQAKAAGGAFCLQAADSSLAGGKLYMAGGEISNNQAISGTAYKAGGGVWLNSGCLFEMTGGAIRDNKANSGGAIYGVGTPTINISNAKLTGNQTTTSGAAIHDDSGSKVTITDSEITGNTCTNGTYGGAVFMGGSNGKLTLSGKVIIGDNDLAGTGIADVNMNKAASDTLYIKDLAAGSDVTFSTPATAAADPDEVMSAISQTGWSVTWVKYKTASGTEKFVDYQDGDFSFAAGHSHEGVEYQPLTSADQLIVGGNYYLAGDVTLTKEANLNPGVTLNLCLNGHKLTSNSGTAGISTRLNAAEATVINVYDCTAHTDASGSYVAGQITGMHNQSTGNGGGAFMIRPKGVLNFYAGIISDCSATVGGGAIFINGEAHIYGGELRNNQAASGTAAKNGGAIFLNDQGILTVENAKFVNNTTPKGAGGAIYATGTLTIKNTEFTGNSAPASSGGAIAYTGKKTISLEGCSFTGNQARSVSAINLGTSGLSAILKDVTVTGNTNTTGYGAVNAVGGVASLKLEGKVIIRDNKGNGKNDLHLQKGAVVADVTGLSAGSGIAVALEDARVEAGQMAFTTASENNKLSYFTSNDAAYLVGINEAKQLYLMAAVKHVHCVCGKTDCTDGTHEQISYTAWTDPASMPKTGNYYLMTDVVAAEQTTTSNGKLNLCLHGHTVTVAETASRRRIYFVGSNSAMNIADCAGNGKITGCTAGTIMTDGAGKNVEINLYGGTTTENHATGTGAAFVMQGQSTLNMYGGVIAGNTAKSGGGVTVYGKNAKFFMYGGTIEGNQATAQGGGLYVSEGTAELNAGTISANKAQHGGGFYATGNAAYVNVQGAEVIGNTANSGGGGIAESGSVVNLSAGKICENKATGSGAGLYISTDCTVNMTGGAMDQNEAASTGGAVYHLGSTGNYSGGSVSGNTAKNGGALSGSLRVRNNTNIPTLVTISGEALFNGNTATSNAGTIYITGEGCTVKIQGGTISGGKAKNAGGILAETKAVIQISGGKLTGNYAESNGGAVYASTNTKLTMTGGSISGNTAKAGAGGIMLLRCTASFNGGSVTGNTAGASGGVKISGANVTISSLTVSGNRAIGTLDAKTGKYTGGNAGGIEIGRAGYKQNNVQQWQYPVVYIYNIYLANNVSNAAAGGMLVQSDGTVFRMSGGTVTGNKSGATGGGGGIYFSTNSRPVVTGGTFVGNESSNGAAIYVLNTTAEISNIVIKQNHSTGTGGGLTVTGKTTVVNVKDVEVFENTADNNAGGMLALNYAYLNLENVKIHDNVSSKRGGGLYYSQPGNGILKNVEIYNNRANEGGGMVADIHSNVTAQNLTVRDNISEGAAGGIFTRGRLEISGGKVLNNTAKETGGGIYSFKTNSSVLVDKTGMFLTDVVVSGNTSGGQGGGIFAHMGCPAYLTNCTVTDNTAALEGGGIYAGGRTNLQSVTVTGNVSGGEGFALYMPEARYDGHSNYTGFKAMGGEMIVKENEGGDLYLGQETVLAITGESLGEKSYVDITIHAGVLSQWVHGVYDYEGGDQHYILTAGNRSLTDPEPYGEQDQTSQQTTRQADTWLYIAIGAVAVIAMGAAALLLTKKKKSAPTEQK